MAILKTLLISLSLALVAAPSNAQYAENISYSQGSDQSEGRSKSYIHYDLIAPYQNIPCAVRVKLSTVEKDHVKTFYLHEVTGDVGNLVYPGTKKGIIWDHIEELVHFTGEISIDIEVTPAVQVPEKIKKRKQLTVSLAPIYTANKSYAVKLFRKEQEIARLNDVLLIEKSFAVTIPKKTKARKKYQLAITDGENTYYSNTFKVKRRVSYGWLVVPILAVPAYMYVDQYLEDNEPLGEPPSIEGN
jgi:hypothetical protein